MKYFLIVGLFFFNISIYSQSDNSNDPLKYLEGASISEGEKLFSSNCSKCHGLCDQKLGPALTDVMYKRPFPWLVKFIRNSSEVIASGDPYANHLFESYSNMEMPHFTQFDENEIRNIIGYLKSESDRARKDTVIGTASEPSSLIEAARNRSYQEEQGDKDYYAMTADLRVPVEEAAGLRGKILFNQHCESCHELCESTVGPALTGITKRRPLPWLLSFIDNPTEVVKTNDNYTNFLVSNYNFIMPQFSFITEKQKLDILAYIRLETASEVSTSGVNSKYIADKALEEAAETDQNESAERDLAEREPSESYEKKQIFRIPLIIITVVILGALVYLLVGYFRK